MIVIESPLQERIVELQEISQQIDTINNEIQQFLPTVITTIENQNVNWSDAKSIRTYSQEANENERIQEPYDHCGVTINLQIDKNEEDNDIEQVTAGIIRIYKISSIKFYNIKRQRRKGTFSPPKTMFYDGFELEPEYIPKNMASNIVKNFANCDDDSERIHVYFEPSKQHLWEQSPPSTTKKSK